MYSYKTEGNGFSVTIYKDSKPICYFQDEDAARLIDDIENCETDEEVQNLLAEYDTQFSWLFISVVPFWLFLRTR